MNSPEEYKYKKTQDFCSGKEISSSMSVLSEKSADEQEEKSFRCLHDERRELKRSGEKGEKTSGDLLTMMSNDVQTTHQVIISASLE